VKRRRVLVVSEPMEYGVLSYLETLFDGLDGTRWEPALACSPRRMAPQGRRLLARLGDRGIRVRTLPFHRGAGLGDARAATAMLREIRAFRPDIVHLHSTKAGLIGRAIARRLGIPALYTPHGTSWRYTGRVVGRVQLLLERALRRMTAALLSVCPEEAKAFVEEVGFDARRIRIVPNGIALPEPERVRELRVQTRATYGIPDDETWLVFVGRLTREKGLDVLLTALRHDVVADGLLVVGDGTERARLEVHAAETGIPVRFCGYQSDVSPFLAAADLLVQPSRSEGLPFAVLEAMAHGVPIVCTRVGGLATAVDGGGVLVEPGDADALAAAVNAMAADADLRRTLGDRARARAARSFNVSSMLAALHTAYEDACAAAGQRHG
jgi:glycosyltransferase involved in cell wall biosynthesis